jgi:hypothetical protein
MVKVQGYNLMLRFQINVNGHYLILTFLINFTDRFKRKFLSLHFNITYGIITYS